MVTRRYRKQEEQLQENTLATSTVRYVKMKNGMQLVIAGQHVTTYEAKKGHHTLHRPPSASAVNRVSFESLQEAATRTIMCARDQGC